jgi:translation initiation factor eIF-2B subunit epsilon
MSKSYDPPRVQSATPFATLTKEASSSTTLSVASIDDLLNVITNKFQVVVYGDVVSNLPLESALVAHRARRAADKNAIMTIVLREADMKHRTHSHGYKPVFVSSNQRLLHYEQILPHATDHFVNIDPELLTLNQELDVRTDLIDCGIDICTPDVLALVIYLRYTSESTF